MVDEDLAPTILVFTDSKNENNYRLKLPNSNIEDFIPAVSQGNWNPKS